MRNAENLLGAPARPGSLFPRCSLFCDAGNLRATGQTASIDYAGIRTSLRRVLRLMRQNNLLAPTRVGSPRGPRNHDGTIIPDTVDVIWGTDLTPPITGEGQATRFIAIDHCSAECVGIHAHPQA